MAKTKDTDKEKVASLILQESTSSNNQVRKNMILESSCFLPELGTFKKRNAKSNPQKHLQCENQELGTQTKRACVTKSQSCTKNYPIVKLHRIEYKSPTLTETQTSEDTVYDGHSEQEQTDLSPYELERLKNMKENSKFLASLQLLEAGYEKYKYCKERQLNSEWSPFVGDAQEKKQKVEEPVIRHSMRLQGIDPSEIPLPKVESQSELSLMKYILLSQHVHPSKKGRSSKEKSDSGTPTDSGNSEVKSSKAKVCMGCDKKATTPMKPPGPVEMIPSNLQEDKEAVQTFLKTWASISQAKNDRSSIQLPLVDLKRYRASLKKMTIREKAVAKVVQDGIVSVAIHPSESRTLVAAGDGGGQVGLWDMDDQSSNNGVYVFVPHSHCVSCMSFCPFNSAQLLSLSYDGTVYCGDVTRSIFDEVYRDEEESFSSFDFLSADASVLIVSHWDAAISLVDLRTPGTSYEHRSSLGMKTARTVSVHPVHRDLCVVAGAWGVNMYDVRQLKQEEAQPVLSVSRHGKNVACAYFSPSTGNRILTTCADDYIRVYDSSSLSSKAPLLTLLRHNNKCSWLTYLRAVWNPKQENCFVVGSMAKPRRIEVYHESGKRLRFFRDSEYLGSVCSINAMHPTRNLLVGGNCSGKLHVFQD
ncbi:WD repeat-containing protein 76-like [Rhinophrynus dorsalis]